MIFDYVWISGLVFGIEHDVVYLTETEKEPNFEEPPNNMIMIHIGFITISIIFL
jgi:hypothetical protein